MPVQKTIVAEKNKVCMKSCLTFCEKNVKSKLLGIKFSRNFFLYKLQFTFYLFVVLYWLLFNFAVAVNNFSVMLRWSHCFLGIYQFFGELKVSCSRTLHGGRGILHNIFDVVH